jgi:uncharacterized membrane protein YraQ (UPF0718 family)
MTVLVFSALLFAVAGWLLILAWRRRDGSARAGAREGWEDFIRLVPRLLVGVVGAGYLAHILPRELVVAWLGPGSGLPGLAAASVAGALTPGGPVVGFALGAAALKAGAGLEQVVAFVTAWSLYTLNRVLVWEVPSMPRHFVVTRLLVSLPLPFLAAGAVALLPR